jgi:hypothetical protein
MRKLPKPKPFRAAKEVKRLARLNVGAPPTEQVQQPKKRRPPKHKKKEIEAEFS